MLKVGESLLLDRGAKGYTWMTVVHEVDYENRILHVFQPEGVPLRTNLVVMEYVDGAYTPVTDESALDAALSMYFER